jgi:hypothetical protein
MEIITQISESIAGTEIAFDNEGFITTNRALKDHIPGIIDLINSYNALGLEQPFDNRLFNEFVNGTGATKAGEEFRKLVEKDMKVFKNPISKFDTANKIEEWIKQIAQPTRKVKDAFDHFNRHNRYQISCADFKIDGNNVSVNEDRLREHFTTYANELQASVYDQFKKLENAYNETVDFLKENNFQFGQRAVVDLFTGKSLIDRYTSDIFKFEVIGKTYNQDDQLGPHIELNKTILTLFK